MATVWFIRHGESLSNAGFATHHTSSTPITTQGHAEAEEVCAAIPRAPDLIVTSPYLRTQETARPAVRRFPTARYDVWPVQEFTYLSIGGSYAGTTSEQRLPLVEKYWDRADPHHVEGPGAESFAGLVARIQGTLDRLKTAEEDFVVVYTHGRLMQVMHLMLTRPELSVQGLMNETLAFCAANPVPNCAVMRVEADANGVRLVAPPQKLSPPAPRKVAGRPPSLG